MGKIDEIVEEKLKNEEVVQVYTEKLEQYNLTGDNVVVTTPHPVNTIMRYHDHEFYEMIAVTQGKCINMVEGTAMHLKAGDIVIMSPDTLHTLFSGGDGREVNILIKPSYFDVLRDRLHFENTPFAEFMLNISKSGGNKYIMFTETESAQSTLSLLLESAEKPHRALYREAVLTALFCQLDSCKASLSENTLYNSDIFKQIFSYTVNNYKTVTLDTLCKVFSYTKPYICKLFKKSTGTTFSDNLASVRLRKAQSLLCTTDMTVEQICFEVGYESTEYFHRLFKKTFGITPLEYRKAHK